MGMASEQDRLWVGSMPEAYERWLAPSVFRPFAQDLARRAARLAPRKVLEIAAGTGVLTKELITALPEADVTATDLNAAMVEFGSRESPNAEWRQADALDLPFRDNQFDLGTCQFGVMFFPDKPGAYREAWRVLKPGGRLAFNVWDRIEANAVTKTVADAVASAFPQDPPRFLDRVPHGYHDEGAIRDALGQAGFEDIAVSVVKKPCRAPSARDPACGFCQGSPLRGEIEARDATRLDEVTGRAEKALVERFGAGPIEGTMQALVIEATRGS
jgi:SAM-dependent methyltransferase